MGQRQRTASPRRRRQTDLPKTQETDAERRKEQESKNHRRLTFPRSKRRGLHPACLVTSQRDNRYGSIITVFRQNTAEVRKNDISRNRYSTTNKLEYGGKPLLESLALLGSPVRLGGAARVRRAEPRIAASRGSR
jgi:hypothetical protein